jgi:hypothetical protein
MDTRMSASVLWLRALFAGSFAFFLGVAGHLMADGLLPGTAFLVVLYVFMVVLSVPVLARPASKLRMLGLMVGGQTFIHLCLTLSAGHVGDPKGPAAAAPHPRDLGFTQLPTVNGRRVGSFQDAFAGSNQLPRTTPTLPIHHLVADMSAHLPMMVAHLVAAAVVALWVAYGEQRLVTVATVTAVIVIAILRPLRTPATPRPMRASLTEVAVAGFRDLRLCRSVSRRGPPLLAG